MAGLPLPAVRRLSKHLSEEPDAPIGEHVGILQIGTALADRVRAKPMAFYEDCLIEQLPACPMGALRIDDLVWCEVDDQRMLERARALVFPRLDPLEVVQRDADALAAVAKA